MLVEQCEILYAAENIASNFDTKVKVIEPYYGIVEEKEDVFYFGHLTSSITVVSPESLSYYLEKNINTFFRSVVDVEGPCFVVGYRITCDNKFYTKALNINMRGTINYTGDIPNNAAYALRSKQNPENVIPLNPEVYTSETQIDIVNVNFQVSSNDPNAYEFIMLDLNTQTIYSDDEQMAHSELQGGVTVFQYVVGFNFPSVIPDLNYRFTFNLDESAFNGYVYIYTVNEMGMRENELGSVEVVNGVPQGDVMSYYRMIPTDRLIFSMNGIESDVVFLGENENIVVGVNAPSGGK